MRLSAYAVFDLMISSDKTLACEYRSQNVAPLTKVSLTIIVVFQFLKCNLELIISWQCLISYSMNSTSGGNWEYVDKKSLTVSLAEPAREDVNTKPFLFIPYNKSLPFKST
jgi:hypothetical protein